MSKDIIKLAQNIVSGKKTTNNNVKSYHETSFIYRTANENMNFYQRYLENREKILTVIGSSEQVFNSVVEDIKNIDIFDISIFPYYYFKLKCAGVETFSSVLDYYHFFYDDPKISLDEIYDDMYDDIRKNLDNDSLEFWDSLFNFFDWSDIVSSTLFSQEPCFSKEILFRNKHLQKEQYYKLRELLPQVNFNTYIGDINQLVGKIDKKYDFINLSNICYYQSIDQYKKLLTQLPLTENGSCLSYFYQINAEIIEKFKMANCSFEKFNGREDGVMIYSKKR